VKVLPNRIKQFKFLFLQPYMVCGQCPPYWLSIAQLTAENYIALPQSIIDEIEPNKSFDVKVDDGKIILTPVSIS
jgi:hypothetical protein